jgi:acyl-coenzyme A synthetase/AMP-(fatty) acid ligase
MVQTPVDTSPQVDVPGMLNVAVEYVDGAVAAGHGDRPAYIYDTERVTFAELQRRVNQVGNVLASLSVEIEQRVAILLPNRPEFVTSFFGAIKIGAVPIAISFAVTPDEQSFLLADSRARAVVTTAALGAAPGAARAVPFLRHVLLSRRRLPARRARFRQAGGRCVNRAGGGADRRRDAASGSIHRAAPARQVAMHLQRNMPGERLYGAVRRAPPGDVIACGSPLPRVSARSPRTSR